MDFRFVAYNPQTGQRLYQLPRANSVQIGDTFGTRGTLELKYSAKAVNAIDLPTFLEVQAEVTFDGGHTWAEVGPSLLRLSGEHEDTDASGMRTLRFVGREWVLDKARVGAGDGELVDGKRAFYQATPGQILRTLLLEAQDRGAAHGIELGGFTEAKDAAGNTWSKSATIYYSPGLPIGSVLENLVEQGLCDYRLDGRTLNLYEPETAMGRDLTDRTNPVRIHGAVTEAPVKYSLEDLASSALLIGDEGFELEVDNPSAPNDYGRLEVTIEQGGVSDSGTARIMVDEALNRGSREIREITRSQSASGAAFLPYRDYRVGDYVQVHTGGQWVRYRVRELQLARDGQEWTIHTIINDRLQELLLKLAKRTNGIVNGSKGSGGDGTRPTPPENPGIEPAAPEGLVIDQQVYLDRQGIARGQITAGWGEVTESTKGQNVEIGGYELWWRRNETQAVWTRAAVTTGDLTVSHSPVVLADVYGNPMEYQWRVRAIASASTRPGPFSDIVTLTMTQDTTPPPPPSLPVVETDLRIVTVEWDGLDEDGEQMPADFNHIRVYFAAAEDMADAERVGSLTQPGMWNSGSMDPDVPVWVAVSAVDHVGNESDMTPAQSVTPKKLVDDESIRDELGTIDDKINTAVDDLNEAIENIVIDANGTTTYWMSTAPDETTDPKPKRGDLWFDTSEEGKNELHRFDGYEWVSAADQRIDMINDAQDALEADVDRVRTSVNGKNAITQSTSTPPNQYDGAEGDVWEVMSSMGSGGRSVSRWRWSGTVWVSNLIGDTVLGNVDAAKIGTGYLDADRIEAGSISADKLLIGGSRNLIPWSQVEAGRTVEPHFVPSGYANAELSLVSGVPEQGLPPHMLITRADSGPSGMQYALHLNPPSTSSELFPGTAGQKYRIKLRLYSADNVSVRITNQTYKSPSTGGFISSIHSETTQLSSVPTDVIAQFTMPSNGGAFNIRLGTSGPGEVGVATPEATEMVGSTLIEDGAITTEHIAVGSITAESGIIADLSAGVIKSGTLDSARIAAGSITADKLLIGAGDELVNNPFFDDSGKSWGNAYYTPEAALPGRSMGVRLEIPASGDGSVYGPSKVGSERVPVEAGQAYEVSAWLRRTAGDVDNISNVHVRAYVYNEAGALTNLAAVWKDPGTFPAGEWVKISGQIETPNDAVECYPRPTLYTTGDWSSASAGWDLGGVSVRKASGATLIEDGAITTDKILANAITAGKIAALAIEADHISANAITADKIRAGAIDGKLITGARIRTAASGRRTELDVEGLRSYDASGNVVLTTQTSDGSIDLKGNLRQVIKGIEMSVGDNFAGANPGISWTDSNLFPVRGGLLYGEDSGSRNVYLQGPGTASAFSGLKVNEGGDGFDLFGQTSSTNWRILSSNSAGTMSIGTLQGRGPYISLRRGTGTSGQAWMGYQHPTNNGYASLVLRDRYIWMGAYDSGGNVVSRLWGDADGTELSAGTRKMGVRGGNGAYMDFVNTSNGPRVQSGTILSVTSDGGWGVRVNNSGTLFSESSSLRYKQDVSPARVMPDILDVEPKSWRNKATMENSAKLAALREEIGSGPVPEYYAEAMNESEVPWQYGAIAEEVDGLGLTELVLYDKYGRPDALQYEKFGVALIPIIRRLRDRVDALEQQLGETA